MTITIDEILAEAERQREELKKLITQYKLKKMLAGLKGADDGQV